jgi:hypothetical protein
MSDGLKFVIGAFIIAIVAIPLLSSLGDSQAAATQTLTAVNESVSLSNGTTTQLAHNQVQSITNVSNSTNTLVLNTDFTANLNQGTLTLIVNKNGTYNATYTYKNVQDPASATIVNLSTLWFALAILFGVVGTLMVNEDFRETVFGYLKR